MVKWKGKNYRTWNDALEAKDKDLSRVSDLLLKRDGEVARLRDELSKALTGRHHE